MAIGLSWLSWIPSALLARDVMSFPPVVPFVLIGFGLPLLGLSSSTAPGSQKPRDHKGSYQSFENQGECVC